VKGIPVSQHESSTFTNEAITGRRDAVWAGCKKNKFSKYEPRNKKGHANEIREAALRILWMKEQRGKVDSEAPIHQPSLKFSSRDQATSRVILKMRQRNG
jgi:hypothetical protein